MSKLSTEDIKKLADLAKIDITSEEEQKYLVDINNILNHVSMVADAEISNGEIVHTFYNSTREDKLESRDFDKQTIFSNIPQKSQDNYVKVSKVIKK